MPRLSQLFKDNLELFSPYFVNVYTVAELAAESTFD